MTYLSNYAIIRNIYLFYYYKTKCDDTMLHIYILDDDTKFVTLLEQKIKKCLLSYDEDFILLSFNNVSTFYEQISHIPPDICFIETDLDGGSTCGLQVAEYLRSHTDVCQLIILSTGLTHVTDSFRFRPTYYILKTELNQRLQDALSISLQNCQASAGGTISLIVNRRKIIIPQNSIVYLEHDQRKTKVVCKAKTFFVRERIPSLINRLGNMFCQCHSGYAINFSYVNSMHSHFFQMVDDTCIPIGRTYLSRVKSHLSKNTFLHFSDN